MVLYGLQTGSEDSEALPGLSLMAAGLIGIAFSFCVLSVSGSGVSRLMESVKLPWVRLRGGDLSTSLLVAGGDGEEKVGTENEEVGGEAGGENCLCLCWRAGGMVRERGGMLAAMAVAAVVLRWENNLWLTLTSTSGTESRKVAASWAQLV